MTRERNLFFEPFRLDLADERLWRQNEPIRLSHKALTILRRLLDDAGRLVTKDELLDAGWPDTSVGEAALTTTVRELRLALGDPARSPRFVETVHGRGYRFIAPVREVVPEPAPSDGPSGKPPESPSKDRLVGRDSELGRLRNLWIQAQQGRRRVCFVAGEAGIGKTALVESFLTGVDGKRARIGHGRCVPQYGAGEPYLPILEALGRLGREDPALVETLERSAPSWLTHLPGLRAVADPERPPERATSDRMLREIAEAMEVMTAERPLVLVVEDLHWSDFSTLEWLGYVARRPDPARLLVLGTYRPVETVLHDHPLRGVVAELRGHSQCEEIVLDYLPGSAITDYLRERRIDVREPERLADVLLARTGGHPLFLVTIVDELTRKGVPAGDPEFVAGFVPVGVRQFLEHRFELLPEEERSLLESASVAGNPFSVAAVAATTSLPEDAIEDRLAAWSRHGLFIEPAGTEVWPDGTTTGRYRFLHDLFQEVLRARLPPGRRSRLHREIGLRLERAWEDRAGTIAARLATHFREGREPLRAVRYLERAARNAMERSAYREARDHLERGRSLVGELPDDGQRAELETTLCLLLGQCLAASEGWGSAEAEEAYRRARHLCEERRDQERLLLALWGLICVTLVRAELRETRELSEELLGNARSLQDRLFELAAHMELGGVAFQLGDPAVALEEFRRARELYEAGDHATHVERIGIDLGLFSRSWETHVLWAVGFTERSRDESDEAIRLARTLGAPLDRAVALTYGATLRQFLRDEDGVDFLASAAIDISAEHGFPYYLAWSGILRGWRRCVGERNPAGLSEIHEGLDVLQAVGGIRLPYFHSLLAEALEAIGRRDEAFEAIEAGLAGIERTSERWWEPELHRLKGELLREASPADAEACFRRATETARKQKAKSLELRAAVNLTRP